MVIGLAARLTSSAEVSGTFNQWMIHLPARGSMFVSLAAGPETDNLHDNSLLAGGTRCQCDMLYHARNILCIESQIAGMERERCASFI